MWGGKRKGSGRSKGEERDWNKYKSEAKRKKLAEASKSSMDIKNFFSSKAKNSSESTEDLKSNSHGQSKKGKVEAMQKMPNQVKQKGDMTQATSKDCVMREEGETKERFHFVEEMGEDADSNGNNIQLQQPGVTELEEGATVASMCEDTEDGRESNMKNDMSVDENENSLNCQPLGGDPSSADGGFGQRSRTQSESNTRQQTLPQDTVRDEISSPSKSTAANIPILKLGSAPPSPLPFFANGCKASGRIEINM
jgi:hypothetical protein